MTDTATRDPADRPHRTATAPWLKNSWYQAAWSRELETAPLLPRKLLDRELLLFRDANGSVCALEDRCPHRFAPLSAGDLRHGVIHCGYHGLGFDGKGACVLNPHGAITSAMGVLTFPVAEKHQAIWVWMGAEPPDLSLLPALDFIDQTLPTAKYFGYMDTASNYQLMTDNILDLSHADYLHPKSLGGVMTGSKTTMREDEAEFVIRWISENCVPPPAYTSLVPPPDRADIWTEVRWRAPALMVLGTGANVSGALRDPNNEAVTLHNMTPASAKRTHYFFCTTRKFKTDDAHFNQALGQLITEAFRSEDKPMLEKQQRVMGDADLWSLGPVLLGIDAGPVKVRRMLAKMIERENSTAAPAVRERHPGV